MKLFLTILLAFLFLSCSKVQQKSIQFALKPYFFDAGGSNSKIDESSFLLTPSFQYSSEYGYGWTSENQKEFFHKGSEKSRGDFLIDGVIGTEIEFKADIPEGNWWLAIWFELGLEDSSTTRFYVQDENITPRLQTFSPEAEPREEIDKTYRLIQQKVVVGDDGIKFRIQGIKDEVRLLGFSLIPVPEQPTGSKGIAVLEDLKKAGKFNSTQDLSEVIKKLEELGESSEYENFAAYWKLQAQIVQEGEKFFNYRGWSKYTEATGMGLFDHIHQGILMYDGMLTNPDAEENLFYERALWYNSRLLYWLWLEGGSYRERDAAHIGLKKMLKIHPEDDLVRMYNGDKIDHPDPFDDVTKPENAPEWAFAEWEMMNRLKHVADWWVNEQQSETGEFGGKFGDDVEILRWWSPLILSGDTVAYNGWKKLADGVWNSSKVYKGYAKRPSDVEHSSEFIADTAPLMVLFNDNPEYADRLAYSSDYFQNLWSGYNDDGLRFFKSAWFSSTEIETESPKNRDVAYNARATKAVRYYAWKTKDQQTITALTEWADAWLEVSQQTSKGKPKGIIPPSVEFPSGEINGKEDNWYTANMVWDYFDWSGAHAILDELLYTWTLTGDEKYLIPINQHLELVSTYKSNLNEPESSFEKGSEEWAAHVLGNSSEFWNVVGTWRLLTGNDDYDQMIIQHGTPFIKYRLTGNKDYLVTGINAFLETIRYNYPMITKEAIHTDRVFIKEGNVREAGILQGMVTGYGIAESSSPYIAVSWEKTSRDVTFLVTDSDSTHLDIDIYSFSEESQTTTMRIWQLEKGTYKITSSFNGNAESKEIEVRERGDRFELSIPSKTLVSINITAIKN